MRLNVLVLLLFLLIASVCVAEKPREPFIVLMVNGKEYKQGDEIVVRFGEKLSVEAILKGGRRDYCSNPQKYANVGKTVIIESSGEDGMSFDVNRGQFKGTWSLKEEFSLFTSSLKVSITQTGRGSVQRSAIILIPQSNVSTILLKVKSSTTWYYERKSAAGKSQKNETNEASATFNLVVKQEEGVWYSSANIVAKGVEDFTVRNELNEVQKFYNKTQQYLLNKDYTSAGREIQNLKNYIGEVKRAINDAKQKNSNYECDVTFVGLPTHMTMEYRYKLNLLFDKWKERFYISQANMAKVNNMLLDTQMTFSANVLRSIFKNYLSWTGNMPPAMEDVPGLLASDAIGRLDMPRQLMGWYTDALKDASILKNQVETIKKLTELRTFYLDNISSYVKERAEIKLLIDEYDTDKQIARELKQYFEGLDWAMWSAIEFY
jgi:hypothetical protein